MKKISTRIELPDGKKITISENANPAIVKMVNKILTDMNK
jgi:hypothetical protein